MTPHGCPFRAVGSNMHVLLNFHYFWTNPKSALSQKPSSRLSSEDATNEIRLTLILRSVRMIWCEDLPANVQYRSVPSHSYQRKIEPGKEKWFGGCILSGRLSYTLERSVPWMSRYSKQYCHVAAHIGCTHADESEYKRCERSRNTLTTTELVWRLDSSMHVWRSR